MGKPSSREVGANHRTLALCDAGGFGGGGGVLAGGAGDGLDGADWPDAPPPHPPIVASDNSNTQCAAVKHRVL